MNRNIRAGLFSTIGIALIVGFSFYVNDRPDWHSRCKNVQIYTDDATGLRRKSPVKTLGLDIGFIKKVSLEGDQVLITVCITAPIQILAETKPYIRSQGFLGDKFLELKPVEMTSYTGAPRRRERTDEEKSEEKVQEKIKVPAKEVGESSSKESLLHDLPSELQEMQRQNDHQEQRARIVPMIIEGALELLIPTAHAEEDAVVRQSAKGDEPLTASRETEMQDLLKKVAKLVDKLTLVMDDIRSVTQQKEFKDTIVNLNSAMKNLEQLLRPEGKVVNNVNASLESLKNTMAQAEEVMKKVNRGEGTIGKLVNDPSIYDEINAAVNSVNILLGRAGSLRTFVDLSAAGINAYDGYKAKFSVKIQPNPGRYYLLGLSNDPRGRVRKKQTQTVTNGGAVTTVDERVTEEKGLKISFLFGKYFGPLDLRAGLIEDNGALGIGYWLDPDRRWGLHAEFFSPDKGEAITARVYARAQVFMGVYITGGVDQTTKYNGKIPYFGGVGLFFDDDDLKYLLAFK